MDISDEQIKQYWADGATVLRDVISPEWRERLAAAIERDIAEPGPFDHSYDVAGGRFHGNLRVWQDDADFAAFCLDSPAVEIAQTFLRATRLNLLYDQLFVKEAGADHRTRWHNDQPYWPVSGRDVISVWVGLDHTTAENGRLEFVRGSHEWDRWFQPEPFGPNSGNSAYDQNPDYEKMLDIEADRPLHVVGDRAVIAVTTQPRRNRNACFNRAIKGLPDVIKARRLKHQMLQSSQVSNLQKGNAVMSRGTSQEVNSHSVRAEMHEVAALESKHVPVEVEGSLDLGHV